MTKLNLSYHLDRSARFLSCNIGFCEMARLIAGADGRAEPYAHHADAGLPGPAAEYTEPWVCGFLSGVVTGRIREMIFYRALLADGVGKVLIITNITSRKRVEEKIVAPNGLLMR